MMKMQVLNDEWIQVLDDGSGFRCLMMERIQVLNDGEDSGAGWRGSRMWVLGEEGCTWSCRCWLERI